MLTTIFRRLPTTFSRRFVSKVHVEEEYYEEFTEEPQKPSKSEKTVSPPKYSGLLLENVIEALEAVRAKDLFVVKVDQAEVSPFSFKIICSAFNARQAAAISENLRSLLRIEGIDITGSVTSHVRKTTRQSNGWFVSEIDSMQVHVMSEECREKYDLEMVWAGDERILEEIEKEKDRIMLPPKRRN